MDPIPQELEPGDPVMDGAAGAALAEVGVSVAVVAGVEAPEGASPGGPLIRPGADGKGPVDIDAFPQPRRREKRLNFKSKSLERRYWLCQV